jgi:type II secretory pathway pseudopilin PulG
MAYGATAGLIEQGCVYMRITRCKRAHRYSAKAFSLAELLVVIGIISLLVAFIIPHVQRARAESMRTKCAANLQQLGIALENVRTEYKFYPLWDDEGSPIRYTWIDVLQQTGNTGSERAGYCPNDRRPDFLNESRGQAARLIYPVNRNRAGIDYSYGINVPLSAGAWVWRPAGANLPPRRLENAESFPTRRVLVADASWSGIFNLSAEGMETGAWNFPTQFDNTVAYRHGAGGANFLMQDNHIERVRYKFDTPAPVDTFRYFIWYPGEPLHVNPTDQFHGNFYPFVPPPSMMSDPPQDVYPRELVPRYYTVNHLWTQVTHK